MNRLDRIVANQTCPRRTRPQAKPRQKKGESSKARAPTAQSGPESAANPGEASPQADEEEAEPLPESNDLGLSRAGRKRMRSERAMGHSGLSP